MSADERDHERTTHILFWPGAITRSMLYRFDETLDWIMGRLDIKAGVELDEVPPSFCIEMKHNPYPFTNDLMREDGSHAKWPGPFGRNTYEGYLPRPPTSVTWWTEKLGIFGPDAKVHMRPYVARWTT